MYVSFLGRLSAQNGAPKSPKGDPSERKEGPKAAQGLPKGDSSGDPKFERERALAKPCSMTLPRHPKATLGTEYHPKLIIWVWILIDVGDFHVFSKLLLAFLSFLLLSFSLPVATTSFPSASYLYLSFPVPSHSFSCSCPRLSLPFLTLRFFPSLAPPCLLLFYYFPIPSCLLVFTPSLTFACRFVFS